MLRCLHAVHMQTGLCALIPTVTNRTATASCIACVHCCAGAGAAPNKTKQVRLVLQLHLGSLASPTAFFCACPARRPARYSLLAQGLIVLMHQHHGSKMSTSHLSVPSCSVLQDAPAPAAAAPPAAPPAQRAPKAAAADGKASTPSKQGSQRAGSSSKGRSPAKHAKAKASAAAASKKRKKADDSDSDVVSVAAGSRKRKGHRMQQCCTCAGMQAGGVLQMRSAGHCRHWGTYRHSRHSPATCRHAS